MGSVQSATTNEADEAAARRNNEIDTQIQADHLKRKNEVRLLVFGSADSGKSSLLKRVKLIHHGAHREATL
ncbi:hypothetical protein GALMADRAFT_244938 [Galerina marginata CBS 339.88]|uniref:Uncharacterized protein n=1 Tax=Galerina marginata (strain CBS 339.88) TaxID=685588 RepID=A0A067TDM6_GALM3|nr:hypothetical protein GALMADRAFT_244938 [Galerina marginata CBS 339.88]